MKPVIQLLPDHLRFDRTHFYATSNERSPTNADVILVLSSTVINRDDVNGYWFVEDIRFTRIDNGCQYHGGAEVEAIDQSEDGRLYRGGIGVESIDHPWPWFYVREDDTANEMWWKCPWQITELLAKHMQPNREERYENELVQEVEREMITDNDAHGVAMVSEESDEASAAEACLTIRALFRCWICKDREFNARHQLIDHILGKGNGGKDHMKMRKKWIAQGQPGCKIWLEMQPANDEKYHLTQTPEMQIKAATSSRWCERQAHQHWTREGRY